MANEHEGADEGVTLEAMEKSLQDLLKAADATELAKSYGGTNVEYSGRTDEDGKGGGGGAGYGEVGGLDDMMIGKMVSAGVPEGLVAEFSAFMSAKQEEPEEEDEEDEDEEKGKAGGKITHERPVAKKSMDAYRESQDVADAIDVSPFLEALTARTADQLDGIRKAHGEFSGTQGRVNQHMAVALAAVGNLVKSQSAVIDALGQRLGLVERTPAAPRGATSERQAQALSKSLPGEVGAGGEQLSKAEVLSTLSYMNLEKGIKQINGQRTFEVIGMLEGGGQVDSGAVDTVRAFLKQNPAEAKAARNYA